MNTISHKTLHILSALTVVILIGLPFQSQAAMYKTVDEHGNVTYSETPPKKYSGKIERIKEPPKPSADPHEALQRLKERSQAFSERRDTRQQSKDQKKQQESQDDANAKICEQMRKNLDVLNNNAKIKQQNKDGKDIYLNDEQRLDQIKTMKKRIAAEC